MPTIQRLAFLVACCCAASGPARATPLDTTLRVMTFNIKGAAVEIGLDQHESWDYLWNNDNDRRARVVSVINNSGADIVGVQELRLGQLDYLDDRLAEYAYYGVGRNTGANSDGAERSGIFYRRSRFTQLDQGEFWLSATPTVPGTTFTGNGGDTNNPRMATWLKLRDVRLEKDYFVINTHWSLDSEARRLSGVLMRDKIIDLAGDLPILAMGDFNEFAANGQGYAALVQPRSPGEFRLTDSYAASGAALGKTFHGYAGGVSGTPIDFVLHTPDHFQAVEGTIVRTAFGGLYPSDHYPVQVTLNVDVRQPGDYDRDDDVDGADFLLWQRSFGRSVTQGDGADGNRDRLVNAADLLIWQTHFGKIASSPGGVQGLFVPEPCTTGLVCSAVAACLSHMGFRRRGRLPRSR